MSNWSTEWLFCCLMIIRLVSFPLNPINMFSILLVFYCVWCMRFVNIERKINTQKTSAAHSLMRIRRTSLHRFDFFFFLFIYIYLVAVVFLFGTFYFHYFILFLFNMIFHYRTFSWVYAVAKFTQHPIHHRRFKMLSSFRIRRMPLDLSLHLHLSRILIRFPFCAPFSTFSSSHR